MSEFFQHEVTQGIAAIRFNRPEKMNAFNYEMWLEFKKLIDGFAKNKDAKALFLFSTNPRFFSTGADMDEFERKSGDKKWRAANFKAIRGAMDALINFPKPTVAGVSGLCLGGGLAIAAACDIRYGEVSAKFSLPPAKIGLVYPFPEVKRLVELIGHSQAAELLFTTRNIDAKVARAMGLITKVFVFDEYEKQLNLLAGQISVLPPSSLIGLKQMLIRVAAGQQKDTKETEALFLNSYDSDHFQKTMKMLRRKSEQIKVNQAGEKAPDKTDGKAKTITTKIKPRPGVKPKSTPARAKAIPKPEKKSTAKAKAIPKPETKSKAPQKSPKKSAAKAKSKAKAKKS
ncbi:MAG: enoyl-CoA hydratase-related protein [Sphingomonadales bacterium]